MSKTLAIAAGMLLLAGCATAPSALQAPPPQIASATGPAHVRPIEVQILGLNDFHGNLEPPKYAIDAVGPDGVAQRVPAGGVAQLATAIRTLRQGHPNSITVSAGDMIGASPLISSYYLDEPTIAAMNLVGVELNAVGNHEFDRGANELLRMQNGGCERFTSRKPCALEPFTGAKFRYLAANVLKGGSTLFPATAIKDFGAVKIGFIGMTLKETGLIASPGGVAGLSFADEADTANALVPALKAQGADAIVILLHQGGRTSGGYNDKSCPNLSGDILPIIARLDPAIDLVISGHTHQAYICSLPRQNAHPLLLTSAGSFGTLVSDIRLRFTPDRHLADLSADNRIIVSDAYSNALGTVAGGPAFPAYAPDPAIGALVARYAADVAPQANRIVGKLSAPVTKKQSPDREITAGDFMSDALLFGGRRQNVQIGFTNDGGVRAELIPAADGSVTYGQVFSMEPFGNNVVAMTLSGAQLKELLEQQFSGGKNTVDQPAILLPSRGFFFSYDTRRPAGDRIVAMRLEGKAIDPKRNYGIAVGSFLASGGEGFTVLKQGRNVTDLGLDLDSTEAYLRTNPKAPELGRIKALAPAAP